MPKRASGSFRIASGGFRGCGNINVDLNEMKKSVPLQVFLLVSLTGFFSKRAICSFCIIYKLHNSYFVIFGNVVNVVIWVFGDFYIFIYYTCCSL